MVGPKRPEFVLFGSSIVQLSFFRGGWGAILANLYSRKADIRLRGYSGWNSRHALEVLCQVFPKDAAEQPELVIAYFGGNDATPPNPEGTGSHVPLQEYVENMRKIALHLQSLSDMTRIVFLSTPPVNEEQIASLPSWVLGESVRDNETSRIYSEALLKLCGEMNIKAVDLWNAIQQRDDWLDVCFTDGLHLSAEGSEIVAKEIVRVLKEVKWEPSLYWGSMPIEFAEPSRFDTLDRDGKPISVSSWTPQNLQKGFNL